MRARSLNISYRVFMVKKACSVPVLKIAVLKSEILLGKLTEDCLTVPDI